MDKRRPWFRRFLVLALTLPATSSALGVGGGALFQILAVENLGLSPAVIGTALGLGVVSIPMQLWAARMPISVVRRNLLWFLALAAAGCWVLAALVAFVEPGDATAFAALGISVLAEIAVSVLFATSWQPLLSRVLTTRDRQSINSRGRAAGGMTLVVLLLAFGSGDAPTRVVILGAIGAAAIATLFVLRDAPIPSASAPALGQPVPHVTRVPRAAARLLVLAGFAASAAWPLFPVYAAEVFWPTVDLGIVGAVETGGALAVAALWRSTEASLVPRARGAAALLVAAALTFVLLPAASASGAVDVVTLAVFGVSVAARSVLLMSLLELVHRVVSDQTAVRVLTILDVIASTSLQVGLFFGGLLITWSARTSWNGADPYQIYTLVIAAAAAASLARVPTQEVGSASAA